MTRTEAITQVNAELLALRNQASFDLRKREDEVCSAIPKLKVLLDRRAELPLRSLRLAMSNRGAAKAISEQMKQEGISLNADIRSVLLSNGYPENHLSLQPRCALCGDTGYIKDTVPAKTCACFERRLSELLNGESNSAGHSFESFDEQKIPEEAIAEGLTQRQLTVRIRQACEDYADQYPDCYKPNLLLSGQAGLGKSFLMDSIAGRIQSRGFACVTISAYRMLEIMRSEHFHEEGCDYAFNELMNCPLLMIDDLGNEPKLRNISEEYLCVVLEERIRNHRHTVITTNLSPTQFKEYYGERVMSRLCDKASWDHLRLMGKDLRRV